MRSYETNLRAPIITAVVVAVIILGGFLVVFNFLPDGTTTTNTQPSGSFGIQAAEYLNSRRDDVEFYWMSNSTFVNQNLTQYYQQTEPTAFVDGVRMTKKLEGGIIEVLFAPYSTDMIGTGEITLNAWSAMSGALIDDAIAQMSNADDHPDNFPSTWPIDFYVTIFFDDNSFFYFGYTSSDQMVYLQNGTWSGGFTEYGHPDITGYAETGYWLSANGMLTTPIDAFYEVITENVAYP